MKKVVIVVVAYLVYAAACFIMEDVTRKKFHVISKADIQALPDHRAQVRAEASQQLQKDQMTTWWPYTASLGLAFVIVGGGTLTATILSIKPIWRNVASYKLTAICIMFVLAGSLMILGMPLQLANGYCESQRTPWPTDTLPTHH